MKLELKTGKEFLRRMNSKGELPLGEALESHPLSNESVLCLCPMEIDDAPYILVCSETFAKQLGKYIIEEPESLSEEDIRRLTQGMTYQTGVDSQKRVQIPEQLTQGLNLDNKMRIVQYSTTLVVFYTLR